MPSVKAHKQQAERNLAFYESISSDFPDWKAVALFYAALHVVEMVATDAGLSQRNHDDREHKFLRPHHPKIWQAYRPLFAASRRGRYLAGDQFDMTAPQVEEQLRKKKFHTIVYWAMEELGHDQLLGLERISKSQATGKRR